MERSGYSAVDDWEDDEDVSDLCIQEIDCRRLLVISPDVSGKMLVRFRWMVNASPSGGGTRARMDLPLVFGKMRKQWHRMKDIGLSMIPKGLFLIQLHCEEDRESVLLEGRRFVWVQFLSANRWFLGQPTMQLLFFRIEPVYISWQAEGVFIFILIGTCFRQLSQCWQRFGKRRFVLVPCCFCCTSWS